MRTTLAVASLLALMVLLSARAADKSMHAGGPRPPPQPQRPLDPGTAELRDQLLALADSSAPQAHHDLVRQLGQEAVLDRLDVPAIRDKSRTGDLVLATILAHLRDNQAPHTSATLGNLCAKGVFASNSQRAELLLRALATRRPLASNSVDFLGHEATSDSVNLHVAVNTLLMNRTRPALTLFERLLADDRIDRIYKIGWLRSDLLEQRRTVEVLNTSKEWLTSKSLARDIKHALAEALFDYRPDEWYPGREGLPRPPAETATSTEARPLVAQVGRIVLDSNYSSKLNARVRSVLSQIP